MPKDDLVDLDGGEIQYGKEMHWRLLRRIIKMTEKRIKKEKKKKSRQKRKR